MGPARRPLPLAGTGTGICAVAAPAAADTLLQTLYANLVGEAPQPGRHVFVARYAHGGMSSGHVDADFWLRQGFPLLRQRLPALRP